MRPFARKKIENYAQENGIVVIDIQVYEQAKQLFNKNFNK
ncbi:MAG: PCP reductase family protein [Sphaerospermopsis kisseleviana]